MDDVYLLAAQMIAQDVLKSHILSSRGQIEMHADLCARCHAPYPCPTAQAAEVVLHRSQELAKENQT